MKKYSEVRTDYFDEEDKVWTVDAWLTPNTDENGSVVAYITEDKRVLYCDPEARWCEVVQDAIKEKLASMQQEFFNVLRVSRDDVDCVDFKGADLTDEQMETIAYRMHNNNECIMDAFWEALRQACEYEGVKRNRQYRVRLIEHNVDEPEDIFGKTYDEFDDAYDTLASFVHSFDGIKQVDGAVYAVDDEEDIEYCSSVM